MLRKIVTALLIVLFLLPVVSVQPVGAWACNSLELVSSSDLNVTVRPDYSVSSDESSDLYWGDGSSVSNPPNKSNIDHSYVDFGDYTITLKVWNADKSDSKNCSVQVQFQKPTETPKVPTATPTATSTLTPENTITNTNTPSGPSITPTKTPKSSKTPKVTKTPKITKTSGPSITPTKTPKHTKTPAKTHRPGATDTKTALPPPTTGAEDESHFPISGVGVFAILAILTATIFGIRRRH